MPGHLRVAGLTGALPASLSAAAVALLRSSLGFNGVVVTDALEMRAVSDPFGIPGAAVRAVAAGNDLLCLGRDVPEDGYLAVRAALVHAVGAGELPESRLAEAAERVAGLRAQLSAWRRTGPGAIDGIGLSAARRALRLTGVLPEPRDPVVVEVEPLVNMAAGDARWGLDAWVPAGSLRVAAVPDAGTAASGAAEALKAATGRSLILVVRDAHRSPATRSLVTAVLAERPDTILVEMGLPYWQPPAGAYQAYLATLRRLPRQRPGRRRAARPHGSSITASSAQPRPARSEGQRGSWIAVQIFSGVSGMSRWRTPYGRRASITALTRAGVTPIVPLSPMPFTPSGFVGRRRAHQVRLDRRQRGGERDRVVHQRRGHRLAGVVVRAPPPTAPGRGPGRSRRAPGPRRAAG